MVLPRAERIVARTAVAEAQVQHPVEAEAHRAAVVVRIRLIHLQHHQLASRVRHAAHHREPRQHRSPGSPRAVVRPEVPARVERDRQQPLLPAVHHPVPDIEQRRLRAPVRVEQPHDPGLICDEHPITVCTKFDRTIKNARPKRGGRIDRSECHDRWWLRRRYLSRQDDHHRRPRRHITAWVQVEECCIGEVGRTHHITRPGRHSCSPRSIRRWGQSWRPRRPSHHPTARGRHPT